MEAHEQVCICLYDEADGGIVHLLFIMWISSSLIDICGSRSVEECSGM